MLLVVRRWWPDRRLVALAGSAYAALEFLVGCRRAQPGPIMVLTRVRAGCGALRAGPTTPPVPDWTAAPEGPAPADPGDHGRRADIAGGLVHLLLLVALALLSYQFVTRLREDERERVDLLLAEPSC